MHETAPESAHHEEEDGHHDESASAGGGGTEDGFLNLEAGIKQQIFTSERHETIISLAAAVVAPTGTERVGAEDHAAIEALGLFAKGFGDLPDALSPLRLLALQGDLGIETPLGDGRPVNEFFWNAALSYDLRLLHQQMDFPSALEPLALVAEFNFETHLNGPARAETGSFVTTGVVYSRDRVQAGVAFQFPMGGHDEADFTVLPTVVILYDKIVPALGRNLIPW